jgi:hypothetical protein
MKELHERINRVIHTRSFERALKNVGIELFEFQASWHELGEMGFDGLPPEYKTAILAGEQEQSGCFELELA